MGGRKYWCIGTGEVDRLELDRRWLRAPGLRRKGLAENLDLRPFGQAGSVAEWTTADDCNKLSFRQPQACRAAIIPEAGRGWP
jgi:hypothetical protein